MGLNYYPSHVLHFRYEMCIRDRLVIALAWSNLQGQFMCVRAINREIENQKLKQELLKN